MSKHIYLGVEESTIDDMIPTRTELIADDIDNVNDLILFWDASEDKTKAMSVQLLVQAGDIGSEFSPGDSLIFVQPTTHSGWTKDSSGNMNDAIIRVTTSASADKAGNIAFSTINGSHSVDVSTPSINNNNYTSAGSTVLVTANLPIHDHQVPVRSSTTYIVDPGDIWATAGGKALEPQNSGTQQWRSTSNGSGSPSSHSHTITGGSHTHTASFVGDDIDFAIRYFDIHIARKD